MAEKTTEAKAAPKAELTVEQQLAAKRTDLLEARRSPASGELVNPRIIGTIRKDIARLLTTINAQKEAK